MTDVANKPSDRLFTVISEPEYKIHSEPKGQVSLSITSLVCYNPQSGAVEQTDDRNIAAILTDVNYDRQSFRATFINLPNSPEKNLKELKDAFKKEHRPRKMGADEILPHLALQPANQRRKYRSQSN